MPHLELMPSKIAVLDQVEEYYNSIRTNIQFSGRDIKTIVVTSVQPGEGKSTTSSYLAISFARAGFKTLLISADIRNFATAGIFHATSKIVGLTNYLSGAAELSDSIFSTDVDNLMVIPAGQSSPNPTSLLQNSNFNAMISTIRELYDYVIIDSPPIGLVIDAAIIAQRCDASLLVTETGLVKRSALQKAKEQMDQSGAQFLGVILNKVNTKLEGYGSYGDYGNYGNYGKSEKKSHYKPTRKRK